jgi:dienelactone hydrolase
MPTQSTPQTLNTPRAFPAITTRHDWEARHKTIRDRILVSCGLYPLPRRTPLRARVFDRVVRDGYTIEKVALQTYPGFYLAGNLYRPSETAEPVPGILVAHGHWEDGRMADGPAGSIAARAITFARMGCIAFTYDMVGFNDTRQIDHRFAYDRRSWLWGVNLMGLQTWNSVRALDFLVSLPDVDPSRLAITGESGGGTQTMMLGAIDDRLAAVAPCVMVSHSMQGGCLCENAPGLRIEHSNMEIAAASAPRPQILVGATGDWTTTTLTVEGPAVASIYGLYDRIDALEYKIVNAGHNINQQSREHVYTFFARHLLGRQGSDGFTEPPYEREPVAQLRVFPDNEPLPSDAKTAEELTQYLMVRGEAELERRKPRDERSLRAFKRRFRPLWEQTLALDSPTTRRQHPKRGNASARTPGLGGHTPPSVQVEIERDAQGNRFQGRLFAPLTPAHEGLVIVDPDNDGAISTEGVLRAGIDSLLQQGRHVLRINAHRSDDSPTSGRNSVHNPFEHYFTTYNRTDLQEHVRDVARACDFLRTRHHSKRVIVLGLGRAGLWALLAAPVADGVAADCSQLDLTTDDRLLADDLFTPGLRRIGDFRMAATLAVPNPLLLHNTGDRFTPTQWISDVYTAVGVAHKLQVFADRLTESDLLEWTHSTFSAE